MGENQCTVSDAPYSQSTTNGVVVDYNAKVKVAFSLQAADIALRDLYKLGNAARTIEAQEFIKSLEAELIDVQQIANLSRKISNQRNIFRQLTQSKLTPLSRLLSRILDQKRDWQQIISKYGNPFNEALPEGERLAIADKIIAKSAGSSDLMNFFQLFGKGLMVVSVGISAWQVGTGINKISNGKTGEGIMDITEGGTGIGLTIGVYSGIKSGSIIITEGTGLATFASGILAAGGLWLAFEEGRRSIRGEKTMATEATEYWAKYAIDGENTRGISGFLEMATGWTFGSFAALIAAGQGN